jgi:hypothetical protein
LAQVSPRRRNNRNPKYGIQTGNLLHPKLHWSGGRRRWQCDTRYEPIRKHLLCARVCDVTPLVWILCPECLWHGVEVDKGWLGDRITK